MAAGDLCRTHDTSSNEYRRLRVIVDDRLVLRGTVPYTTADAIVMVVAEEIAELGLVLCDGDGGSPCACCCGGFPGQDRQRQRLHLIMRWMLYTDQHQER
jgi:hypothetical protein